MINVLSKKWLAITIYIFLDILTIGLGMGVPFFTIIFGSLVGWLLPEFLKLPPDLSLDSLRKLLRAAALSVMVSLAILGAIWLPAALSWLRNSSKDLAQFGMPLILFEPRASFIGWICLMVLISPFMQFLMTLLGGVIKLAYFGKGENQTTDH